MALNALTTLVEKSAISFMEFADTNRNVPLNQLIQKYTESTDGDFDDSANDNTTGTSADASADAAAADNVEDVLANACLDLKYNIYVECKKVINQLRMDFVNSARDALKMEIKMELLHELGKLSPDDRTDDSPASTQEPAQSFSFLSDNEFQNIKPISLQPISLENNPLFKRISEGFERKKQGLSYYDGDQEITRRFGDLPTEELEKNGVDLEKLKEASSICEPETEEINDLFEQMLRDKLNI